ncbi:hybrid sensor histidine kinase/response regulator [Oleidesulfovibrio sp.]|uniref:ATP-binding response regulator n=1 Tax=Oleidesulfovibrio sp. TaxID=2909707 RepID=UPI003A86F65F
MSIPLDELQSRMWVKPYMSVLPDVSGSMTIAEAASARQVGEYVPFDAIPFRSDARTLWVKMTLLGTDTTASSTAERFQLLPVNSEQRAADQTDVPANQPDSGNQTGKTPQPESGQTLYHTTAHSFPVLQLGPTAPTPVELYVPAPHLTGGWQRITVSGTTVPLPSIHATPVTVYLRLAGVPGPWFQPVLHEASGAFDGAITAALPMHMVQGFLLALLLLNCALWFTSRARWRLWASACVIAVLVHSFSPVATTTLFSWDSVAALFLPGIALLTLAQTGRRMLNSDTAPKTDRLFALCMVLGAVLALLPLIPQLRFLHVALPLWPLLAIPLALPALGRWQEGVAGSGRYLLACLLPAAGTVAGMSAALTPDAPLWATLGPAVGMALGLLSLSCGPVQENNAPCTAASKEPEESLITDAQPDFEQQEPSLTASSLLARVSHDLRTPLTAIIHAAEQLAIETGPHSTSKQLNLIQAAGRNLQLQINDLIDAARAAKGRTTLKSNRFNLHHVLEEAHEIALIKAGHKGLQLSWFMSPHMLVNFRGDADRILQIVLNLLGNAIRFTDEGTIRLSVGRVEDSTDSGHLLFAISDTGIGIPLENPYAVFDNFCVSPGTGSGRYGGMGLGLSIARDLVSMMGGVICLESTPGAGTTISFTLRLQPASQLPQGLATGLDRQPGLVLLTDDIASNRQLVTFFLEDTPLAFVEARSGAEAVRKFRRRLPALVMIDSQMPGMNGPDTVRTLRKAESELGLMPGPILGIVRSGDEQAANAMRAAGCSSILLRPFTRGTLLAVVSETIEHIRPAAESAAGAVQQASTTQTATPVIAIQTDSIGEERNGKKKETTDDEPEKQATHALEPAETSEQKAIPSNEEKGADADSETHNDNFPEKENSTTVDIKAQKADVPPALQQTREQHSEKELPEHPVQPEEGHHGEEVEEGIPSVLTPETFARISAAVAALAEPRQTAVTKRMGHDAKTEAFAENPDLNSLRTADAMSPQPAEKMVQSRPAFNVQEQNNSELPTQLKSLKDSLVSGKKAVVLGSLPQVQLASANIAATASELGLQALHRIARCVADASAAGDNDAVRDLFDELESATIRNLKALEDLHKMQTAIKQ